MSSLLCSSGAVLCCGLCIWLPLPPGCRASVGVLSSLKSYVFKQVWISGQNTLAIFCSFYFTELEGEIRVHWFKICENSCFQRKITAVIKKNSMLFYCWGAELSAQWQSGKRSFFLKMGAWLYYGRLFSFLYKLNTEVSFSLIYYLGLYRGEQAKRCQVLWRRYVEMI